jgi:hypothetical protein
LKLIPEPSGDLAFKSSTAFQPVIQKKGICLVKDHRSSVPNANARHLAYIAELNGGKLLYRHTRHQPYDTRLYPPNVTYLRKPFDLPPIFLEKFIHTQDAATVEQAYFRIGKHKGLPTD